MARACLVDALKLIVAPLNALAALVAEVNETFGAAVSVGIEPPAARRAL